MQLVTLYRYVAESIRTSPEHPTVVFIDRKTDNFVQIQQPDKYDFYLQCIYHAAKDNP